MATGTGTGAHRHARAAPWAPGTRQAARFSSSGGSPHLQRRGVIRILCNGCQHSAPLRARAHGCGLPNTIGQRAKRTGPESCANWVHRPCILRLAFPSQGLPHRPTSKRKRSNPERRAVFVRCCSLTSISPNPSMTLQPARRKGCSADLWTCGHAQGAPQLALSEIDVWEAPQAVEGCGSGYASSQRRRGSPV